MFYLDDFRGVPTNLAIRIDDRVWSEVFDLCKLIPFLRTIMPLKHKERIPFTHNEQEISFKLNHMLN